MNIHIQIVENTIQFFCHFAALSREDFGGEVIERAVKDAVRNSGWTLCRDGVIKDDDGAKQDFWITLPVAGMDSWEYKSPHFTLSGGDDNGATYEGIFDGIYETEDCARKDAALWISRLDGEELFSGASCHQVKLWQVNTVNECGDVIDSELIDSWSVGGCRVVAGNRVEIPFAQS